MEIELFCLAQSISGLRLDPGISRFDANPKQGKLETATEGPSLFGFNTGMALGLRSIAPPSVWAVSRVAHCRGGGKEQKG